MRRRSFALLLAALFVASVDVASAQEGPALSTPAPILTLADALRLAERHSPGIARARNALGTTAAERRAARAAFLPAVSASTSFDVTRIRRFTTTDVFGDPAERAQAVEATTRGAQQGVFVDLTLFDGGRALADVRVTGARHEATRAALDTARIQVRADVARAYFDLLERHRAVDVERAILEERRRDVETTERLFQRAAADPIDLLDVRIGARRQLAAVEAAEEAVVAARLQLALVTGAAIAPGVRLEPPIEPFDPHSLDREALVRGALSRHPEIRVLIARLDAAEADARNDGWLAHLPRVAATASYWRSEFGGGDQPFFELDPRDTGASFGLRVTLPLFDRLDRYAERARASGAAADAREALRARRRAVETEVHTRFLELRAAWRELRLEEEAASMSRERADLARGKYEIGAIDVIRLREATDGATRAERALVRRRFDYYRALAALELAAGRSIALPAAAGAEPGPP